MERRRSRLCSQDGKRLGSGGVKDQVAKLEEQAQAQQQMMQEQDNRRMNQRVEILKLMQEMRGEMEKEQKDYRDMMEKKLKAANDEIDGLKSQLKVQRGHTTALHEQCRNIHSNVKSIDQDVQELITEVVGQ